VKDKGFSLIELIIVLVLLSLSLALVTPSLSRFSKTIESRAAAKKVSGLLRYFRSEAVQKGRVYQVLFDPDLREIRTRGLELAEERGNKYTLPEGMQMREMKISSSQYPSDFPTIEFYPNGGSNGGSVLFGYQDHKGYRIKVHFLTGMVEVEEG